MDGERVFKGSVGFDLSLFANIPRPAPFMLRYPKLELSLHC